MKVEKHSDTEIVLTDTFDADRERVFAALTQPEHILRWMKPSGMELVGCEFDLRAGGTLRYVFKRPNGRRLEVRGAIEEVRAPSRLAYTESYDFSPLVLHVTTTLDDAKGRTAFRQLLRYKSKAERDEDFDPVATSSVEAYANLERYLAQAER